MSSRLTSTVTVNGDIDYSNSGELRTAVQQLVDQGCYSIELDMSRVDFIDSSGMRVLLEYAKAMPQRGGYLRILGPSTVVSRTLNRMGIGEMLGIPTQHIAEVSDGYPAYPADRYARVIEFSLPSEPRSPSVIRKRVDEVAAGLPFSNTERMDIRLAVGEAAANAVRHGSSLDGGTISVRCTANESSLVVEISDTGTGFNPNGVGAPEIARLPTGGMGLAIIRMVMDDVSFGFDGGTTIRMVKLLSKARS